MNEPRAPDGSSGEVLRTPSLLRRLLDAVVSPGKMGRDVAADPRWLGAMLVCAVILALSVALIPWELFAEISRRMAIQSGRPAPEFTDRLQTAIRVGSIAGTGLSFVVLSLVGAGVNTFIFAFVLGDEGRYRQYLAIGVHAAVIPALVSLVLAPMRIAAEDPQLTINVGTFLPFLSGGYVAGVLQALDLSRVWSTLVVARGIHAIDRRRSFGSAARIQLAVLLLIALVAGWLLARQG